jgi:mannose-1-phosphate guanylyltransferase
MTAWPPPALVLTAGLGTRLRPLTDRRAKPALPVGDEALVVRVLRQLAAQGITDAVLNLHHLPATVTRVVGDGGGTGVRVRYSWEVPGPLGSAGGIRHALPLIDADTLLVVNGDSMCDLPLSTLVEDHHRTGALVTLGLMPHPVLRKYGGVLLAADGAVTGFPGRSSEQHTWHYPGIQVVNRQAFASLPDNEPAESVREVYPSLMSSRPGCIRGRVFEASWLDVGTVDDYLTTCSALAGDAAGNVVHRDASVAPDAALVRSVVWAGGRVEAGCRLTSCVVTDGAVVPAGTVADGRVFMNPT